MDKPWVVRFGAVPLRRNGAGREVMQKRGREQGVFGKRFVGLVVHFVLVDWGISQTSVAGTPDGRDSEARAILSPVEFGDASASLDA